MTGQRTIAGMVAVLLAVAGAGPETFESLAPYQTEEEAADVGLNLGIGSAVLEGPKTVEVLTHQTWTLVYTAGKAGIQPGGGIRVAMRHLVQWSPPQTNKPDADGYLTVKADGDAPINVYVEFNAFGKRFFHQYHPWQNIVEVTLPERGLEPGQTIRMTYGDRSGGSRGIRIQPFDEAPFTFKLYVDALGDDHYLPMTDNPTVEIVAAEPYRLGAVMPSDADLTAPTWCIVRAEDRYGNPATRYRGTVTLSADDPQATLPAPYTFTESDRGVHRFEGIHFKSLGSFTITADDGHMKRAANPVRVAQRPPDPLLLWGDLHGHTLYSDGRGTVEQFYEFAERVAGLDFCAVTDHDFEILDHMWAHSKEVTNAVYKPGRFVTFQAYEWSGMTDVGGDHNVFFLDDDPPLYRCRSYYNYRNLQMYHGPTAQVNHVEDFFAVLANNHPPRTVFCIPHWGGRKGNPAWHNPKVQRMIEIFSEHRRSEDWATDFLKNRYRLGIIAATDGHFGNPGHGYLKPTYDWTTQEIGMAAVAVYAKDRTRESIFNALYDRRCYATSGDRIILDVRADGFPMGSEILQTSRSPVLSVHAVGTAPITRIEIKKNSDVVHTIDAAGQTAFDADWQDPAFNPDDPCYYYVRVLQANNEEAISSPIWVN